MRRAGPPTVVLLLFTLCAAPVEAQPDDREARTHFASGSSYYSQGRYDDALREFTEAFRLASDPNKPLMLFNMAQAQERLGRIEEAVASFRRYLELDPNAEGRAAIEERVRTLTERLGATAIVLTVSEEGAHVFVDGHEVGTTPLPGPLTVAPGSHELRVEKDGFQAFRLRVSVDAGRQVEADATLVALVGPTSTVTPPVTSARERPGRPLPWILGGAAVLAVGAGTLLGVLALGKSDDAADESAGNRDLYDEHLADAETLAAAADICFGVGIAAGAVSIVLFLIGGQDDSAPATTSVRVSPLALRGGGGLVLGGGF